MREFVRGLLTRMVAGLGRIPLRSRTGDGHNLTVGRETDELLMDAPHGRESEPENGQSSPGSGGRDTVKHHGRVYIVGAGPGDPGLLTLKGKRCLEEADVIVYDYLVNEDLLAYSPPGAIRIRLGKPGSADRLSQDEINRLLVQRARTGKAVVRLKGGDPFIFSRGGEEAEALAEAGVAFEIVPGVTSAIAVPTYAGIPLTHRHLASTVAFVTGHEGVDKDVSGIDWKAVAGMGTVIFLMGVSRLSQIVGRLIEEGRSPETPVAVIEWGTWPWQRTATGTLRDIREKARRIRRPAVIVVGEVVRLRNRLAWFAERAASRRGPESRRQQEAAPTKAFKT